MKNKKNDFLVVEDGTSVYMISRNELQWTDEDVEVLKSLPSFEEAEIYADKKQAEISNDGKY